MENHPYWQVEKYKENLILNVLTVVLSTLYEKVDDDTHSSLIKALGCPRGIGWEGGVPGVHYKGHMNTQGRLMSMYGKKTQHNIVTK